MPHVHAMLKYSGHGLSRCTLVWRIATPPPAELARQSRTRPIGFVEATLFTWMNPKAWVSALGAVAAYSTVGGHVLLQTSVIGGRSRCSAYCHACLGRLRHAYRSPDHPTPRPNGLQLLDGRPAGALADTRIVGLMRARREAESVGICIDWYLPAPWGTT